MRNLTTGTNLQPNRADQFSERSTEKVLHNANRPVGDGPGRRRRTSKLHSCQGHARLRNPLLHHHCFLVPSHPPSQRIFTLKRPRDATTGLAGGELGGAVSICIYTARSFGFLCDERDGCCCCCCPSIHSSIPSCLSLLRGRPSFFL